MANLPIGGRHVRAVRNSELKDFVPLLRPGRRRRLQRARDTLTERVTRGAVVCSCRPYAFLDALPARLE
jgi:hypothetical protein